MMAARIKPSDSRLWFPWVPPPMGPRWLAFQGTRDDPIRHTFHEGTIGAELAFGDVDNNTLYAKARREYEENR